MKALVLVACSILFCTSPSRAQSDRSSTAVALYERALEHLRNDPQPAFARYRISMDARGGNLSFLLEPDGRTALTVEIGGSGSPHLDTDATYDTLDRRLAIETEDGRFGIARTSLYAATTSGILDLIRRGVESPASEPTSVSTPAPAASAEPDLPVIAAVTALGTGNYRVEDAGPAQCDNGLPARTMHLIAFDDPRRHPLTDATVELQSGRFCTMRLSVVFRRMHPTGHAILDLHFGVAGDYTIVTSLHEDVALRALGVTVAHYSLDVRYTGFTFRTPAEQDRLSRSPSGAQ